MIALFDNLGTFELIICGVAGLLVFGRRLPEVASQAGATLAKFKRSLDGAVQDSGVENELRKIKEALPTDVSMRDVARAAARKMEDRMRELGEAPSLDAAGNPTTAGSGSTSPNATASDAPPAIATTPGTYPPKTGADALEPITPPRAGDGAATGDAAAEGFVPMPPPKPSAPRPSDGVDPARHFGPPGSVPRE